MKSRPRFTLLFGSVTGKAESIAELIAEEGEKRGFDVSIHCMSMVNKEVGLNHVDKTTLFVHGFSVSVWM